MVLYRCHRCGVVATNIAASGFAQQADRLACARCSQSTAATPDHVVPVPVLPAGEIHLNP